MRWLIVAVASVLLIADVASSQTTAQLCTLAKQQGNTVFLKTNCQPTPKPQTRRIVAQRKASPVAPVLSAPREQARPVEVQRQTPPAAAPLPAPVAQAHDSESSAPAAIQSYSRPNITGLWSGWHECGGRRVGTLAAISVDNSGNLTGTRAFYSTEDTSGQASGSFRISGTYERATGAVSMMAGAWLKYPLGYGKCDLVGSVDSAGIVIRGAAPGCGGCGEFELRRQ
jgi:hypothetical protein